TMKELLSSERSQWHVLLVITLLVQTVLASLNFPFTGLLTGNPLFYIDSPYHWYNMNFAASIAKMGNVVGYDPFFGAGHLDGVFYYHSGRVPALLAVLLSQIVDHMLIYKVYVFFAAILSPLALPAAARAFRFTTAEGAVASILGILMW